MADTTIYSVAGMAIFDLDGTLISLEGVNGGHGRAIFHALGDVFGIEKADFEGIDFHGMTDAQLIVALLSKYGKEREITDSRMFDLYSGMARFYKRELRDARIDPLPGVLTLLNQLLERRVMTCLATGSICEIAAFKLRKAGLAVNLYIREYGDSALLRSDLVKKLLKRNGTNFWAPKDRIVLFGDTVRDIEAGKECGIKTVAVATGLVARDELKKARPDYLFDDLTRTEEILAIFFE